MSTLATDVESRLGEAARRAASGPTVTRSAVCVRAGSRRRPQSTRCRRSCGWRRTAAWPSCRGRRDAARSGALRPTRATSCSTSPGWTGWSSTPPVTSSRSRRPGRRLDDLQARLASAGQWLAVDPPRRGTVGGLVATAATGPTRLLHGPVRDLVIGTTMVRADGVVAKSGGKVVKNVAGYDLGKLLTGSYGTLGVVTQVAFRLHPLPEASRWVTVPVRSATEAQDVVLRVAHSHLVAGRVSSSTGRGGARRGRGAARRHPRRGRGPDARRARAPRRRAPRRRTPPRLVGCRAGRRRRSAPDHPTRSPRSAGCSPRSTAPPRRPERTRIPAAVPASARSTSSSTGMTRCWSWAVCAAAAPRVRRGGRRPRRPPGGQGRPRRVGAGARAGPDAPGQGAVRPGTGCCHPAVSWEGSERRPSRWSPPSTSAPSRRPSQRPGSSPTACTAGSACPACPTYVLWGEEMDSPRGRIYLMDQGLAGRADDRLDGRALRRLPRLHGLCDRLPVRGAVRPAHRGHPSPGRAAPRAVPCRQGPPRGHLRAVPLPEAAAGRCAVRCGSTSGPGCRAAPPVGLLDRLSPTLAAMEGLAPPLRRPASRCPSGLRRAAPGAGSSACSSAACSASSSPASTPPRPGCCAAEGFDVVAAASQGCCGALSSHNGREEEAQRFARALIEDVRGGRRRRGRRQLRRLRLGDEGLRPPVLRRPGVRGAGRGIAAKVRDVAEFLVEVGPVRRAPPARRDRRLPRRLPPGARPGDPEPAARAAARHTRAGAEGDRRGRAVLRVGRDLQHPQPRAGPRAGRPQGRQRPRDRRRAARHRQPGLPHADRPRRSSAPAAAMALAHTVEVLDASIRGVKVGDKVART